MVKCALLTLCELNIYSEIRKYSFLNDNKVDYCDYFVTYRQGFVGVTISLKTKYVLHNACANLKKIK